MNRMVGRDHGFDIVSGPVADEGVYYVLMLFESGAISKMDAIHKLKSAKLDGQVLFHTDKSLESITFIGYREVR